MSSEGSTYALVIQTDATDPNTGKPISAHYYPITPSSTPGQTNVVYTQEAVDSKPVTTKSEVFYTQEPVTTAPTPTPASLTPTVTAVAIPSTQTKQQYPVIPDQPPAPQYQVPEQYPVADQYQYPVADQYPYADNYADMAPEYNTHPCMKASVVILFILVLGFGVWFVLTQISVVKSPLM